MEGIRNTGTVAHTIEVKSTEPSSLIKKISNLLKTIWNALFGKEVKPLEPARLTPLSTGVFELKYGDGTQEVIFDETADLDPRDVHIAKTEGLSRFNPVLMRMRGEIDSRGMEAAYRKYHLLQVARGDMGATRSYL